MTSPILIQGSGVFSPKLRQQALVRKQISQNSQGYIGVSIATSGSETLDPANLSVKVYNRTDFTTYQTEPIEPPVFTATGNQIFQEDVGTYYIEIGPALTSQLSTLTAVWTYVDDDAESLVYIESFEIVEQMPFYDSLRDGEKYIVDQISWMMGDLFDSTEGGPNLVERFQTHFNFERIAQLEAIAVARMNIQGVPVTGFSVGTGTPWPDQLSGLLLIGTYLEVLRHFMRSYVEQPDFQNLSVTYTQRRDYLQRWKTIYDDEKPGFDNNLKLAKRKFLGLGHGALIVSGGIFGSANGAGIFRSGTYAAGVQSYRFFGAAPAIAFGNGWGGVWGH